MTFVNLFDGDTVCSCQNMLADKNIHDIEASNRRKCSTICNGQNCGESGSMYIYQNNEVSNPLSTCEDALMFSDLNFQDKVILNLPNGENKEVQKGQHCKYFLIVLVQTYLK